MRAVLRIVAAVFLVVAAVVPGILAWRAAGESTISDQGWLALIVGGALTAALGCGLMVAVFYSSRRGYDDRADAMGSNLESDLNPPD